MSNIIYKVKDNGVVYTFSTRPGEINNEIRMLKAAGTLRHYINIKNFLSNYFRFEKTFVRRGGIVTRRIANAIATNVIENYSEYEMENFEIDENSKLVVNCERIQTDSVIGHSPVSMFADTIDIYRNFDEKCTVKCILYGFAKNLICNYCESKITLEQLIATNDEKNTLHNLCLQNANYIQSIRYYHELPKKHHYRRIFNYNNAAYVGTMQTYPEMATWEDRMKTFYEKNEYNIYLAKLGFYIKNGFTCCIWCGTCYDKKFKKYELEYEHFLFYNCIGYLTLPYRLKTVAEIGTDIILDFEKTLNPECSAEEDSLTRKFTLELITSPKYYQLSNFDSVKNLILHFVIRTNEYRYYEEYGYWFNYDTFRFNLSCAIFNFIQNLNIASSVGMFESNLPITLEPYLTAREIITCVVCYTEKNCVTIHPCKHRNVCFDCIMLVHDFCPFCRAPIHCISSEEPISEEPRKEIVVTTPNDVTNYSSSATAIINDNIEVTIPEQLNDIVVSLLNDVVSDIINGVITEFPVEVPLGGGDEIVISRVLSTP